MYLYFKSIPFETIPGSEKIIAKMFPFEAIIKDSEKGDMFPGKTILDIKKLVSARIKVTRYFNFIEVIYALIPSPEFIFFLSNSILTPPS